MLLAARTRAGPAVLQIRQPELSGFRRADGLHRQRRADRAAALFRADAEIPPRRARATAPCSRRKRCARGSQAAFDPLPIWYAPYEEASVDRDAFPLHALTQRPMIMYHSWGSQNAWLRQILGRNKLYIARAKARELGLADDDWVRVTSHNGAIKVQIKTDGRRQPRHGLDLERDRQARGRLEPRREAPRSAQALPAQPSDQRIAAGQGAERRSNSDPVTGQAAWFDLCVRIEKCEAGEECSEPQFPALPRLRGSRRRRRTSANTAPTTPRAKATRMTSLPATTQPEAARPRDRSRHLRRLSRLRDQLQGMERQRPQRAADRRQRLSGRAARRLVQPRLHL